MVDTRQLIRSVKNDFQTIKGLSMVGEDLWRAPYTKEDRQVKTYLVNVMEDKGFMVEEDAVGNLFGMIQGHGGGKTIMAGSHLDTVRNGGEYDGLYGVLAAIYAMEDLVKTYGPPKRNIAVAGLMEEEGSRFLGGYIGSKALVGGLSQADLVMTDARGISLHQAMKDAGGNPEGIGQAKREDLAAFYEMHIEQGPILEGEQMQVGLVESINGLLVLQITVHGRQDHAGTTPMDMRQDALLHASKLIAKLDSMTSETETPSTATVGELTLKPGSSNVVADFVRFTLDIRSSDSKAIKRIFQMVRDDLGRIEAAGLTVEVSVMLDEAPVRLDQGLLAENELICSEKDFSYLRMHSGAGHDSQVIAPHIPAALIFVPCIGGKSHSPEEMMTDKAMVDGISLLAGILYEKAWK